MMCDFCEDSVLTVNDSEILEAMRLAAERMKLIIGTSAAAALAPAILGNQLEEKFPGLKRVAVILCGGNADVRALYGM